MRATSPAAANRLAGRTRRGQCAEDLAAALLGSRGLRIAARNWRRDGREGGELDIVAAAADGTCVFVEVRSRTGVDRGHALEAVTPRKRTQVVRAARLYLEAEKPHATGYRFDVVAVTFWDDGRPPEVVHVPNAFETG